MDTKGLLDSLLSSGQQYADQGKAFAETKLGVPNAGPERDAMLSGMSKGALAAGALALLVGTKGGRKLSGGLLKVGSVAAIGGLAFKAFQQWQGKDDAVATDGGFQPISSTHSDAEQRSTRVLRAMIAAAKADGHIDEKERHAIKQHLLKVGDTPALNNFVTGELEKPLNAWDVADGVNDKEQAAELYLATLLVVDRTNPMERTYLNTLTTALDLDAALAAKLEQEVDNLG